jgi:hypothetical protein
MRIGRGFDMCMEGMDVVIVCMTRKRYQDLQLLQGMNNISLRLGTSPSKTTSLKISKRSPHSHRAQAVYLPELQSNPPE